MNLDMGLRNIPRDVEDGVVPFLLDWERKSEVHERIKCDGNLAVVN